MTVSKMLVENLHHAWCSAIRNGNPIVVIYDSSPHLLYEYKDMESSYSGRQCWNKVSVSTEDVEKLYKLVVKASSSMSKVKCCRLSKKTNGFRLRIEDFETKEVQIHYVNLVLNRVAGFIDEESKVDSPLPVKLAEQKVAVNKEKKKMNDFSLSNLKDAIIDKVTHLDKKTITILAILALLLLIVGKYQDIKDILLGIKDKVKRSKNFKAMVEDGTNAINGLKKIVGIKDKGAKNEA